MRDLAYCVVALSGVLAFLCGIQLNRPPHRYAWYFMAAGASAWVVADGVWVWYQDVAHVEPFPSLADVPYLAGYALLSGGLLALVHGREAGYRLTSMLDSAILIVGLGLPAWVFLIEPIWSDPGEPTLTRLVGCAYPLAGALFVGVFVRLGTSPGSWAPGARLLAGALSVMLIVESISLAAPFVPAIDAHPDLLDPGWLVAYVLWGAAALHPTMGAVSWPVTERVEKTTTARMAVLAMAVLLGPAILAGDLIAGEPLHAVAVVGACALMVPLISVRTIRIVRQLENQAERLGRLADTDFGTGLASRRRFADALGAFLADPRGRTIGLLLIDLERFAEISDTLGQQAGDAILHAIGQRLRGLTGDGAVVARMGSDTFGVIEPLITSGEQAELAAVRIQDALERPLSLPNLTVSVEVCIGAMVLPIDGPDPEQALMRADVALAVARARPERVARYGVELETGSALAPLLIGELREAIGHGDVVVHYQPQVHLPTGRVIGVEALVRWQHPSRGLLGPDTFIPAAEHTGLIRPLLRHVLDSALLQCSRWQAEGLDLTVAVNLSVRNLLDPGLVADVSAALQRHGVAASSLELELTEGSAMVDPRRSILVLGALAQLGVTLSIDDYGTGHSSLAYMQRLPVRRLKIDRSFVTGMVADDASAAIVHSTIELARALGLDVVAEGIEDDATLLVLRDMQCYAAQGFGLGRPVMAPLVPGLIRRIEARLATVLDPQPRRAEPQPARRSQNAVGLGFAPRKF
ncbi:MAG: putative bifunctional diguanylate cyclase/phosphodiesterase [Cellulomonas sp.]